MFSPLLLALTVLVQSDRVQVGSSTLAADEPPVRIWLNGDRRFEPGAGARLQVEARDDGYLLVFNFDTEGRVRVLFPLDPSDDGFVRGGRRYEVRTDRERTSFTVGEAGSGFVYAALAPDPWRVRDWARGDAWDYGRLAIDPTSADPEHDLTLLAEGASTDRGFDYDIIEYFVDDIEVVRYEYRPQYFSGPGVYSFDPGCDPYWSSGWYCGGRSGAVISYGRLYLNDWWSIGYGPSWYWPGQYGYSYRGYSYGRGYSHYSYYRPWIVTGPTYRPGINQTYLAGRSRDYVVGRSTTPRTFDNTGQSGRPVAEPSDNYRDRPASTGRARPVSREPEPVKDFRGRPAVDRSPDRGADRSRPSNGATRPEARPSSDRPSVERNPTAARPASPPSARARPRGGNDSDNESRSARTEPPRTVKAEPSRREASPAPAPRSAPPRAAAPPRAEPRSAPSKPASRGDPPARSRSRPGQ